MRMWGGIRRSLGWKVFLTYLIIIVIAGAALVTTAELQMPVAFERHLAAMAAQMGDSGTMSEDLFANFRSALIESGTIAVLTSMVLAIAVSIYISRRIVLPIQEMLHVTQRIANGDYRQRIELAPSEASAENLDEVGQLALSFNRMAGTLERTEVMRRELIGNVAHELRTPLTFIKGYMEGLIDGVMPADADTFDLVYREADRLQRLVYDLQELSRLEEGTLSLDLRPLSVAALVRGAEERLWPQFQEKDIELEILVPDGLPQVLGDRDRLDQVLVNLLGNALQYTPSGRRVIVSAAEHAEHVRIAVVDEGVGIAPEHLPHVFERFYRVDRSRSRVGGGTGIGLTICKHVVEAHGGTIRAASEGVGKGSTFSFTIPLA